MANSWADILRLEGTESGVATIIRAKQDAFATDTKRMVHKWQDGSFSYWQPDGVTGIDPATVEYTYVGWSEVNNVKEALDTQMRGGYWSASVAGYTGVPVWGGDNRWDEGQALYSTDGNVYIVPAGYTGASAVGCRFVLSPSPSQQYNYIGAHQQMRYRYETGGNFGEIEVTNWATGDKQLKLKAMRGHVTLDTGDAPVSDNGIKFEGFDGFSGMFNAAATGMYRDIQLDPDGDVVVSPSDHKYTYKLGSFDLWAGAESCTGSVGPFPVIYERFGNTVTLHFTNDNAGVWGSPGRDAFYLCGMPLDLYPSNQVQISLLTWGDDEAGQTTGEGQGKMLIPDSSSGITGMSVYRLKDLGGSGYAPSYETNDWTVAKRKGLRAQTVQYYLA